MYTKTQDIFHLVSLATLSDVNPSPRVNTFFSRLVFRVLQFPLLHEQFTSKLLKSRIRSVCAKGEFALEHAWAEHISEAADPHQALERFPYFKNYDCLTSREWQLISHRSSTAKNIVFLGSGPLPLTAILLATRHACTVTLVDVDPAAVETSKRLIDALNIHNINVVHADAESFNELSDADVVYVAALVGQTEKERADIYRQLATRMKKDSFLLTRSAYASRTMLYRPISKLIDKYFHRIAELHPHDDVINSTILLRPYA